MATTKKNSHITNMSKTNKKELLEIYKTTKSDDELKKKIAAFYKEKGIERPTIQDRWEVEAKRYE